MIELREPPAPATAAELAEADRRLAEFGHAIPPAYRAFLEEHDGGEPVRDRFTYVQDNQPKPGTLDEFLGVAPVEPPLVNLVVMVGILGERMLPGVVPIALDPGGNLVCIDTRDRSDGPVVFWDHEYEGDPPDAANLYPIAPDFPTFLASLREPEPLPPRKPRGLKRLFGRR
jgi:cell wall assembly regulator SMI1